MVLLHSRSDIRLIHAPQFSLPSVVDGKVYTLDDFKESKALLLAFICNHCPYVRAIEDRLIALSRSFSSRDFALVGIAANDAVRYPNDSPEQLKKRWEEKNYGFVYLYDADQSLAKTMDAVCTPDLFLFDDERKLFYHGQLDDNWQYPGNVRKESLKEAINAIVDGKPAPQDQKPSMGCSIKWRDEHS